MSHEFLTAMLQFPMYVLLPAFVFTLVRVRQARIVVGPVIAAERPGTKPWRAVVVGLHVAVAIIVVVRRDVPIAPAWTVLAIGAWLAVISPGSRDAVCGEDGVQRGFYPRRFAELEEWRLTGSHLRFRLFGEWTSVPLPEAAQPRIRAKLLEVAPERESRFQD